MASVFVAIPWIMALYRLGRDVKRSMTGYNKALKNGIVTLDSPAEGEESREPGKRTAEPALKVAFNFQVYSLASRFGKSVSHQERHVFYFGTPAWWQKILAKSESHTVNSTLIIQGENLNVTAELDGTTLHDSAALYKEECNGNAKTDLG